jgi:homocysteine S-methyltransferase
MLLEFKAALAPSADMYLAETISSWAEVQAILEHIGNADKPLWISLTLTPDSAAQGEVTLRDGTSLQAFLKLLVPRLAEINGLLFNCCQPEEITAAMVLVAAQVVPYVDANFLIGGYPNAFDERANDGASNATLHSMREDMTPSQYALLALEWQQLGANVLGGCCGIEPEHIQALSQQLSKLP